MKILTAAQIREADACTIQSEPVSSYQLMERAAHACFEWIKKHFSHTFRFDIICGPGNNGGDGLAIARMLLMDAYKVKVYLLRPDAGSSLSRDAHKNYNILHQLHPDCIRYIQDPKDLSELEPGSVLLDCIFGTGLNRTVEGWYASCIDTLNTHRGFKIAVDLPSGLPADDLPASHYIFRADHTLSFQVYKRTFLHPESKGYTGEVHILDIRLSAAYLSSIETENYVADEAWVKQHFRKREQNTHKGNFGHVAIIAGSYGMMGAAVLSCQAALRSGCGLVTGIIPGKGIDIMQVSIPEVMCSTSGKNTLYAYSRFRICRGHWHRSGFGTAP
ncbi:MAG: NAD(P)H-hydrate epimerase [Taibaiella sp.]|nr:NAD(P)H-hydrate epimerase [Taibaiella sp.]